MDDDELKKDIEAPLIGEDDALTLSKSEQPDDDMDDYFDRELRSVERELEDLDSKQTA